MQFGHFPGQCEADSVAAHPSWRAEPLEEFEHAFLKFRGDPGAVVVNAERGLLFILPDVERDFHGGCPKTQGILKQVSEGQLQASWISFHLDVPLRSSPLQLFLVNKGLKSL